MDAGFLRVEALGLVFVNIEMQDSPPRCPSHVVNVQLGELPCSLILKKFQLSQMIKTDITSNDVLSILKHPLVKPILWLSNDREERG